jgi:hypothetical protein
MTTTKKSLKCVKQSPMPGTPFVLGVLCLLDVPYLLGVFFLSCDLESRTKAEPQHPARHELHPIPSTSSILNFLPHHELHPASSTSPHSITSSLHYLHPSKIKIPSICGLTNRPHKPSQHLRTGFRHPSPTIDGIDQNLLHSFGIFSIPGLVHITFALESCRRRLRPLVILNAKYFRFNCPKCTFDCLKAQIFWIRLRTSQSTHHPPHLQKTGIY